MNTKKPALDQDSSRTVGIWHTVAAYMIWGLLPLYWKVLKHIPSQEILAHRIFWSFVFLVIILSINRGWYDVYKTIKNRQKFVYIIFCAFVLSINWYLYIWAVNSGNVVETSMGYYINPLISVLFGVLILKERLTRWQIVSFFLATLGVLIITLQYNTLPWISLWLAVTFALYGLFKKLAGVNSLTGVMLETGIVAPLAFCYLMSKYIGGTDVSGKLSATTILLLVCSGIVTAAPLLFFANGVNRIPLSMVGFLQYLSPTLNLVLGVFVFKEEFTRMHLMSFGLIWCALAVYTLSQMKITQEMKIKVKST